MAKISVAFGATPDWLKYTYVTICSILSNANKHDEYKFYIMSEKSDDDFSEIYKRLNEIKPFEYKFIKMDNSEFDGLVHDTRVGISALYRLKLSTLTDVDKIIYLDSDVVITDDLAKLWSYKIDDYLIAGVEDKYSNMMGCHAGLNDNETYINSGVMVMNLKKFRQDGLEEIIFTKLKENSTYSDQDVINNVCREKILQLPLKYNLITTRDDANSYPERREEYEKSFSHPVIMHYTIKPWILPVQYSEHWYKYAELIKHSD